MVLPVKGIWKDFSTGKGGNAVSFLMEHEHYSYPEAIRYLAKKYNIEIDEIDNNVIDAEDGDLLQRFALGPLTDRQHRDNSSHPEDHA